MVAALTKEAQLKSETLKSERWESMYFGGGTPSILPIDSVSLIMDEIEKIILPTSFREFTFEMNPEHVSRDYLNGLKDLGINRISLGVQTFFEPSLKYINRGHDRKLAIDAIELIKSYSEFDLGIDLIFGIPDMKKSNLLKDLEIIRKFNPDHISAYSLTIEEKTKFGLMEKQGKLIPEADEVYLDQFFEIDNFFSSNGYDHYEISNFALPGKRSIHNANYWSGLSYEGIGPSAHSFNQRERKWNIANNGKYIQSLEQGIIPEEIEVLSTLMKVNERIMTRLRTKTGLDLKRLKTEFDVDLLDRNKAYLDLLIHDEKCVISDGFLKLTLSGWYISDEIVSKLFLTD